MSHHEIDARLNDYVDGILSGEERRELEAHIEDCADCREQLAQLGALLAEAAELPRTIQPARDLWSDVASEIERRRIGQRSIWSMRYALAAAAVVLIAISSTITAVIVTHGPRAKAQPPQGGVVDATSPASSLLVSWQEAEIGYLRATAELQEALDVAKGRLAPETAQRIEQNLRIIDAAIQESRAALAADPHNQEVVQTLLETYEKKLDVLQQVTRLTSRI